MIHFSQVHLGLDALEGDDWICFSAHVLQCWLLFPAEVTKVSRTGDIG